MKLACNAKKERNLAHESDSPNSDNTDSLN